MKNLRNNTPAVIISLIIPVVIIFGFMMYEVTSVLTGDKVAFVVQGYDPTDFLRGHYIRYDVLNGMTDNISIADPQNGPNLSERFYYEDGYIAFNDSNNDGIYDSFGDFYWEKPNIPYIKGNCTYYIYENSDPRYTFRLNHHQDRYYLDENLASFVEDEINKADEFYIVGTAKDGYFRASHIEVNGNIY